jgi:predicted nucleic acid-binding protein
LIALGIFRLEGPTFALSRAAADLTITKAYRSPDALQLQTAISAGCTVFLAADSKLLNAAKSEGLETLNAADDVTIQGWLASLP